MVEVIDVLPANAPRAIRFAILVRAMPVLAVAVNPRGHVVYLARYGYA